MCVCVWERIPFFFLPGPAGYRCIVELIWRGSSGRAQEGVQRGRGRAREKPTGPWMAAKGARA